MPKRKLIPYILLLFEWSVLCYVGPGKVQGVVLSMSLLGMSIALLLYSLFKRQLWLAVMLFFMLSYSVEPVLYFMEADMIIGYRGRQVCTNVETVYGVALCCFLFYISMGAFLNLYRAQMVYRAKPFVIQSSIFLWAFCVILSLIMMAFGKTGSNIFESGGYGRGGAQVSTMFSYAFIPLAVALIYSDNRRKRRCVYCVMAMYVIKDLIYGGRVDSIMLLLVAYMIYFRYKLGFNTTFIAVFFAFVGFSTWGYFRANTDTGISMSFGTAVDNLGFNTGNSGDVYYASMRIIYLMKHGFLELGDRMTSLVYFLLSVVAPYSSLPPLANLSLYLTRVYSSGGGGLAPVFIYAWLGYVGVVIVGALVGRLLTKLASGKCGKYFFLFGIFAVATVPRWYAYYPITLIKFCLFAMLFFVFTEVLRTKKLK